MTATDKKDELLEQLLSPETAVVEQDFITSSMLRDAHYDKLSKSLTVHFKNSLDTTYVFYDVPLNVAQELFMAKSCGAYFVKNIKAGQYVFAKLTKPKEDKSK